MCKAAAILTYLYLLMETNLDDIMATTMSLPKKTQIRTEIPTKQLRTRYLGPNCELIYVIGDEPVRHNKRLMRVQSTTEYGKMEGDFQIRSTSLEYTVEPLGNEWYLILRETHTNYYPNRDFDRDISALKQAVESAAEVYELKILEDKTNRV